jgi:hypothetical protein
VIRVTHTRGLAASWAPTLSKTNTLYFTSNRDGKPEIYKLVEGKVLGVTHTHGTGKSWAPIISNTGTLYFTSNRDGKPEIYKLTRGKVTRVSHTKGITASWLQYLAGMGLDPNWNLSSGFKSLLPILDFTIPLTVHQEQSIAGGRLSNKAISTVVSFEMHLIQSCNIPAWI